MRLGFEANHHDHGMSWDFERFSRSWLSTHIEFRWSASWTAGAYRVRATWTSDHSSLVPLGSPAFRRTTCALQDRTLLPQTQELADHRLRSKLTRP